MKFVYALLFLIGSASIVFADECSPEELKSTAALSNLTAREVVPKYFLGGKRITASLLSCDRDGPTITAEVQIDWIGAVFWWNYYSVKGTLASNAERPPNTYEITWGNDSVQALEFWGNLLGRVIELTSKVI